MAKKKDGKTYRVNIRMSAEEFYKLQKLTKLSGKSKSYTIIFAIERLYDVIFK